MAEQASLTVQSVVNQLTLNSIAAAKFEDVATITNYNAVHRFTIVGPLLVGEHLDVEEGNVEFTADVTDFAGWGMVGLPLLNEGSGISAFALRPGGSLLGPGGHGVGGGTPTYIGAVSDVLDVAWVDTNVPQGISLCLVDMQWYLDSASGDLAPQFEITYGYGGPNPRLMTKVVDNLYCSFDYDSRHVSIRHVKFAVFNPDPGYQAIWCKSTISSAAETQLIHANSTYYDDADSLGTPVIASGISDLANVVVPLADSRARVQCSIAAPNGVLLSKFRGHKRFEYTNYPEPAGTSLPLIMGDQIGYPPNAKFSAKLNPAFYWSATAVPIYSE